MRTPNRILMGGLALLAPQWLWAQASPFMTGATALQSNILILRCSASEGGGTSRFASTLIGQREVLRNTTSRTSRADEWLGTTTRSEHFNIEPAVMDSEIEQLPDLSGYLKFASQGHWYRVDLPPREATEDQVATLGFVPVPTPGSVAATPNPAPMPAQAQAPMPAAPTVSPTKGRPRPAATRVRAPRPAAPRRTPGLNTPRTGTAPPAPDRGPGATP